MPWDTEVEFKQPVDPDLHLVCLRLTQHYRKELFQSLADDKPERTCALVGCDAVTTAGKKRDIVAMVLEVPAKLLFRPVTMLKVLPVFLVAFVTPILFVPLFFPPKDPEPIEPLPESGGDKKSE